jgi:hypothetical protein
MILLWGVDDDKPLAVVREELLARGASAVFLDQTRTLDFQVDTRFGAKIRGRIAVGDTTIPLEEVGAAYIRPQDFRTFLGNRRDRRGSAMRQRAALHDDILLSWADLSDALVLNRPAAMASNSSKPLQSTRIRAAGFSVPATLVTTDPDAARRFAADKHAVIYKSISGVRSIVRRLTAAKRRALGDVVWCPTQFQEWIEGIDYRIHVVGSRLFSCRIDSSDDDYRYGTARMEPATLPDTVATRCLQLSRELNLPLAGIDLRFTPDGDWFCFEVNPSPAFSCFEEAADGRIGPAIADLLIAGDRLTSAPRARRR